jgi:hypothetical protein
MIGESPVCLKASPPLTGRLAGMNASSGWRVPPPGCCQRLGMDGFFMSERQKLNRSLEWARRELDGVRAAAAWMEGWGMTTGQAIEYALAQDVP